MRLTKRGRMYAKLEAKGWLICHVGANTWTVISPVGVHVATGDSRTEAEWKAIQLDAMKSKAYLAQQVQELDQEFGMYS